MAVRIVAIVLAGFGATIVASLCLGLTLLNVLRLQLCRLEKLVLGFVLGAVLLSNAEFVLAAVGQARKGAFLIIAAVSLAAYLATRGRAGLPLKAKPLPMDA